MRKSIFVLICFVILLGSACVVTPARQTNSLKVAVLSDNPSILDMMNQINESMLYSYHHGLLKFSPRFTGTINCSLAAQYIYNSFHDMGLAVEYYDWNYAGFTCKDVVATLNGTDMNSSSYYVLSGHFDTVKVAPGADDDGSGVAAVLAIASVLSHYRFSHTIKFITFSGEEVGTLGSFMYARDASHRGDNIVAVLNMDMIGYANTTEGGKTLVFHLPLRSQWIGEYAIQVAAKYNYMLNMQVITTPNYRGADQQSFVDYGYDGVWISHQDGYPWGHSSNDTEDKLNWSYYVNATKLMLAETVEFTQQPLDVQVMLRRPLQGYLYVFNQPVMRSPFGRKEFYGLRGLTFIIGGRTIARADVISKDPIKYVVFCIDGDFMTWDYAPPYDYRIQGWFFPILGRHTLEVYAYTTTGEVASDEMNIFILEASTSYKG